MRQGDRDTQTRGTLRHRGRTHSGNEDPLVEEGLRDRYGGFVAADDDGDDLGGVVGDVGGAVMPGKLTARKVGEQDLLQGFEELSRRGERAGGLLAGSDQ